jgi:multicomponent Na+:H+ antiporter subunit F
MADFLFVCAGIILAAVAVGLFTVFRGRPVADCMMAAQLIGTGGMAVLILPAVATGISPIIDVALMLALLAAFAAAAFVRGMSDPEPEK